MPKPQQFLPETKRELALWNELKKLKRQQWYAKRKLIPGFLERRRAMAKKWRKRNPGMS